MGLVSVPPPCAAEPGSQGTDAGCRTSGATARDQRGFDAEREGRVLYSTYKGGLTAALFVRLLRQMMQHRTKRIHLLADGLPARKTKLVRDHVQSTVGS